jgi:hypothetical protein
MRFSGDPCLAGTVPVAERVFLGVGVVCVMNGFSFSSVSFNTTRLFCRVDDAGESVSMVLRVRFPNSIVSAMTALSGKEAACGGRCEWVVVLDWWFREGALYA